MGYLQGTVCYDTWAEWQDATYTAVPPSYTPGSTTYETWLAKSSGVWNVCRAELSSTGVRSGQYCVAAPPFTSATVPTCDVSTPLVDGGAMGFLVLLVLLAGWGAIKAKEQIR